MAKSKEFLYVGHYYDVNGLYILKVGTTNDLARRNKEHNTNYWKADNYKMPRRERFQYDWYIPLSKYNTLRYEDKTRALWQEMGVGKFVKNDRFACERKPDKVLVKIRKVYEIALA